MSSLLDVFMSATIMILRSDVKEYVYFSETILVDLVRFNKLLFFIYVHFTRFHIYLIPPWSLSIGCDNYKVESF